MASARMKIGRIAGSGTPCARTAASSASSASLKMRR
jgi:hypothetical protein